jgi:hypothetical protein
MIRDIIIIVGVGVAAAALGRMFPLLLKSPLCSIFQGRGVAS